MNKPLSLEEKLTHLEHNQEVIIKSLETIKNHLWTSPKETDASKLQEQEAIDYVKNVLKPKAEGVGAQGFWQGAALNYLKQKALDFIGTTLKQAVIEKLVDLSKFLFENLQEQIISLYNKATPEEKKAFKEKIREVYPDSELLKKLG